MARRPDADMGMAEKGCFGCAVGLLLAVYPMTLLPGVEGERSELTIIAWSRAIIYSLLTVIARDHAPGLAVTAGTAAAIYWLDVIGNHFAPIP